MHWFETLLSRILKAKPQQKLVCSAGLSVSGLQHVGRLRGEVILANTIANGELTFDLARLREAIHRPIRKERPHDRKEVESELEELIPGATLVGCSEFGRAVIRHMDDE